MGYRPNQLAVSLIKKHTNTVGLIISDIRNLFFSTLAKAIEDECHIYGQNLILCNTNDEHKRDLDYIKVLSDRGVDSIVYCMSQDSSIDDVLESCELMNHLFLPFVLVDRYIKNKNYYVVRTDHVYGGYLATNHLIQNGRRRIACVTGPMHLQDAIDRVEGYKRALLEAGNEIDNELIFPGNYMVESGKEAVKVLKNKKIDAIFASNDMMAFGVYNQAKKEHLHIPDDIALVGYDDIFLSEILETPLTTIHQPIREMGKAAVQHLLKIEQNSEPNQEELILKPKLVVRESSGARKKN